MNNLGYLNVLETSSENFYACHRSRGILEYVND